ncbi:MAG: lactate racemase domain-containing protein [Planctomycetota bacterium]
MEYFFEGSRNTVIDEARARELVDGLLDQLGALQRVLIVPPDITRFHSGSGPLVCHLYRRMQSASEVEIMPAIGTHVPMTAEELDRMYPGIPHDRFRVHDWRHDLVRLGEVPGSVIAELSEGKLDYPIPIEINRLLLEGKWDAIISVGQLVPHEVIGIANHAKNIFVGTGGRDTIPEPISWAPVFGMERIMGEARTPVRAVLDYASQHFAAALPIRYLLTVRGKNEAGRLVTRGLFAGDDEACFLRGAELSRQVNLDELDRPIGKAIVFLDPDEFKSTWLGNKAVYRTRMAMKTGGELVVLAPGVHMFGEDAKIDELIRQFGYRGTPTTLKAVSENQELRENLSAAAHLIHGSSEGRFRITYCPGGLTKNEIEGVGFEFADLQNMLKRYSPHSLNDGWNTLPDGEEVFFVSNPGLGLWTCPNQ